MIHCLFTRDLLLAKRILASGSSSSFNEVWLDSGLACVACVACDAKPLLSSRFNFLAVLAFVLVL